MDPEPYALHAFLSTCVWRDAIVTIIQNYSGFFNFGNFNFDYGDEVSLVYGCGITLRGQMWYFGGRDAYKRQVTSKAN